MKLRIGHGQDIHRLVQGRRLLLGGVHVPAPFGLLGHSDGDVVLHAIGDAILGAIGRGDIGGFFPDTDARYRDADSAELLAAIVAMMDQQGFCIVNIDVTVSAERPRLAPHREDIRRRIAEITGADVASISLKAKTNEGLDAVGNGEAIAATAVVLLQSSPDTTAGT
jgi:2-C-methyl-D-erythritol 2,4-cyclodiphosphate synthase